MSISKTVVHGGPCSVAPGAVGLVQPGGQGSTHKTALIGSPMETLSHDPVFADEQNLLRSHSFAALLERIRDRIIRPMGGEEKSSQRLIDVKRSLHGTRWLQFQGRGCQGRTQECQDGTKYGSEAHSEVAHTVAASKVLRSHPFFAARRRTEYCCKGAAFCENSATKEEIPRSVQLPE